MSKMPEYITKKQALSAMRKATNCTWDDIWNTEYVLNSVPAADVAPVIYAKWKFVAGPDEDNNLQFMCDNCGAGDVHAADVTVPYCWKCGARMDGHEWTEVNEDAE